MNGLLLALAAIAALAACVAALCAWLGLRRGESGRPTREMSDKLLLIETAVQAQPGHFRDELRSLRETSDTRAGALREELRNIMAGFQQGLTEGQVAATNATELATKAFSDFQRERLDRMEQAQKSGLDAVAAQLREMKDAAAADAAKVRQDLADQLEQVRKDSEARQEKMRETLNTQLDHLRKDNEAKLEQMRATVDEKLQGTLEKRLGESFKQVSEQLASVHQGLGDMKTLASDVGGLQRVLTNVKSRGGWGEVQLSRLIEDRFTADHYERNFRPGKSGEVVEYAIKLPGRDEDGCFIPIDSKFPIETYERLLAAQERGDLAEIDRAGRALDQVIRAEAQRICKYLQPPRTTDFAVMFLPTEGLYAEVIRRPGLFDELQRDRRVTVTGPTTLSAFLTSLDLGFRTVQIEQRASEVWQVLGAAKAEFQKYGEVWDKLGKQLDTARKTVDEAGKRTRAVERKLRGVEILESAEARESQRLLALAGAPENEDEAA